MNGDLISRESLKKALHNFFDGKVIDEPAYILRDVFCYIDSAPIVDAYTIEDIQEVQENSLILGAKLAQRPQGEITNDDIQQAIKEGFANGYEMAKEKIIHSIAKQYSEHNELVPIWLSIGDIKGDAEA